MSQVYEDMSEAQIRVQATAATEKLLRSLRKHHTPITFRVVHVLSERAKIRDSENDLQIEEVERIKSAVCEFFGIKREDLMGDHRRFAWPRQIAMYLVREDLKISFPQTARRFRRIDHTTALFAYRKVKRAIPGPDGCAITLASIRNLVESV